MLINVNTDHGDPVRVGRAILEYDPDVLVLEEVNVRWLEKLAGCLIGYPHSETRPRPDNFGIALYSRLPLRGCEVLEVGGAGIPSIRARIISAAGEFTVIATHPLRPGGAEYTERRNAHLAALPDLVRSCSAPVVLVGDLNTTPWSYHFRRLVRDSGLRDSSRGRGVQPTWPADLWPLRIPLDHCLHSPEIDVVNKEIGPSVGSDHLPVIVDFALPGQ
jgi:endonuclease/exonuclease/phosphatase (EEP) superfamily protein YafD